MKTTGNLFALSALGIAFLSHCASPTPATHSPSLVEKSPPPKKFNFPESTLSAYRRLYEEIPENGIAETIAAALDLANPLPLPFGEWQDHRFDSGDPIAFIDAKKLVRSHYKVFAFEAAKGKSYRITYYGKSDRAGEGSPEPRVHVAFPAIQFSEAPKKLEVLGSVYTSPSLSQARLEVEWMYLAHKTEVVRLFVGTLPVERTHPKYKEVFATSNRFLVFLPVELTARLKKRAVSEPIPWAKITKGSPPILATVGEFELKVDAL